MSEKVMTVAERLQTVEAAIKLTQNHLDSLSESVRETIGGVMLTLQGIIIASGEGFDAKVQKVIDEKQKERVDAQVAKGKGQVDALVSQGVLVAADTVTPNTLVVGRVTDPEGNIIMPRLQKEFQLLPPEAQEGMLGKSVGFTWNSGEGSLFEIQEIYVINVEGADAS